MTLQSRQPDYANEQVVERHRLPPRAYFLPERNVLLNGRWKFNYASTPREAPHPAFISSREEPAARSLEEAPVRWEPIVVPGHWQLQGFGSPHYTNIQYPFPCRPPEVPSDNATGTYWRTFAIPVAWGDPASLQLRLRFEGVDSAFHLYVNGLQVGYSQGSRNPAEFDISKYICPGENHLMVRVYRWCDGSYIEDQDQWWLSGIFRDVHLLGFPLKGFIEDFAVNTNLDSEYQDAALEVTVDVRSEEKTSLRIELFSQEGASVVDSSNDDLNPIDRLHKFSFQVKNPSKWTAETPYLYSLRLSLLLDGNVLAHIQHAVGFRAVEISDGLLKVNGRPILLKGVNRHDHSPTLGRAVSLDNIREDLWLMKRHNINALRCSHYPNRPELLHIADEIGLYVVDETDLECHGFYEAVARPMDIPDDMDYEKSKAITFAKAAEFTSDNPTWEHAYVERLRQMVHRDRNHPSIILWSLGNEAFYGRNHKAMYDWVKDIDPSRPVHYEGDVDALSADVYSYMYTSIEDLLKLAEGGTRTKDKPIILCEYGHAMGNGPGALKEYQEAFYKHPRLQGGFIWEWANHGLLHMPRGRGERSEPPFLGYGGDFGDFPNDGTFVMDGLCNSNHTPGPGLREFKKVIEPVSVAFDGHELQVTNLYDFISLDGLRLMYLVTNYGSRESQIVDSGELQIPDIGPGQTAPIHWQPNIPDGQKTDPLWVRFSFLLRKPENWSLVSHEVAWADFNLTSEVRLGPIEPTGMANVEKVENLATVTLKSWDSEFVFDKIKALLLEWSCNGRNIIGRGGFPCLSFWRAPTDNDRPHDLPYWERFGLNRMGEDVRSTTAGWQPSGTNPATAGQSPSQTFEITVESWISPPVLSWGFKTTTMYRFHGSAGLEIKIRAVPEGPFPKTLPRIGLEVHLPPNMHRVQWMGLGPGETYRDKKEAGQIGIWKQFDDDMITNYEVPQENGLRHQTRWLEMTSEAGPGLKVWMQKHEPAEEESQSGLFDFSIQRNTAAEIEEAGHPHELPPSTSMILRVDAGHHGLGTASCGPGVLPQHELRTQTFSFSVFLAPVQKL